MFEQYYPIAILFLLIGGVVALITALTTMIGPTKGNRNKYEPFEAGSRPIGDTRARFSVKFYVVAIVFILFDIETVFLYPWAILFKEYAAASAGLAILMFAEMAIFVAILAVGLIYVWRKGALEWE